MKIVAPVDVSDVPLHDADEEDTAAVEQKKPPRDKAGTSSQLSGLVGTNAPEAGDSASSAEKKPRITLKQAANRVMAAQNVAAFRARVDEMTYRRVYETIQERYKAFSQENELGHGGKEGLTGNIDDISSGDLISILRHIATNDERRTAASIKSAVSPLFSKIYLMENKEQGWNLRSHLYSVGGGAQGAEERQHFHRWTLASAFMAGGFANRNYQKLPASEVDSADVLIEYKLEPTPKNATRQKFIEIGPVGMPLTRQTMFKQGEVRHYPIDLPHSVGDTSQHTGTGLTLAHTGKAIKSTSTSYRTQSGITSEPLDKPASPEEFIASIHKEITLLQLQTLSNGLNRHLGEKDPAKLTSQEKRHLEDYKAPNYLETSLMPAIAILHLAREAGTESAEFSPETARFINAQIRRIDEAPLDTLLKENQTHLQRGYLSAKVSSWDELTAMVEGANRD
ncbi:hypothetical protein CY652_05050 [Burkholderia sp. WAC0059]|uniref:hypothetical protein n=1 Tax=Burkholderia sp. WAC0059 TaxID=2066022 RepID=UPI000C7EFBD8|nr:hypothetical protein [Burkholderia sp. WAC0059]PLZ03747.1 hypothetical protein CY652_05050 [Burkholderia sp. WAC0059]